MTTNSTDFANGTVVTKEWLNDVDAATFDYVVNVKLYGALGDGTTDDTTAIQAAINAAGTANVPLVFPPATYLVSNLTFDNSAGSIPFGVYGNGSTLKAKTGSTGYLVTITNPHGGSGTNTFEFNGFTLDGNSQNETFRLNGCQHGLFKRLRAINSSGVGFFIDADGSHGIYYTTFEQCVAGKNGSTNGSDGWKIVTSALHTGTAQAGGASTITLDSSASSTDDYYAGDTIVITSGTGSGQARNVGSYVGATKVATMTAAWTTQPDNTSVFKVVDGVRNQNNTFTSCFAQFNKGRGFYLDFLTGVFVGCGAEKNDSYGWQVDYTTQVSFIGGYSEHNHEMWATNGSSDGSGDESFWLSETQQSSVVVLGGRHIGTASGTWTQGGDIWLTGGSSQTIRQEPSGTLRIPTDLDGATSTLNLKAGGLQYAQLDGANSLWRFIKPKKDDRSSMTHSSGATLSFGTTTTSFVHVTLTSNATAILMPSASDGREVEIHFTQDGTGGRTLAGWPANVRFAGGSFTLTATAGKTDILRFRYNTGLSAWVEVSRTQNC